MIGATQSMPMSGMAGHARVQRARPLRLRQKTRSPNASKRAWNPARLTWKPSRPVWPRPFGSEAGGIVSEDGTVDFEALSSLLVEQREARMQASLAERFGSEAVASVTGEDGEIDHEALRALVGESGTDMPPPPRGGEGGYGPSGGAAGGGRDPLIDLFA